MNKIKVILFIATLLGIIYFVSAQTAPFGPEVTSIYLFDASQLGYINSCMSNLSQTPCFDNDGGYSPRFQSTFAAFAGPMSPVTFIGQTYTYWAPSGQYQCIVSTESCDPNTGQLIEFVCGSSMGINSYVGFGQAAPNHIWGGVGQPVALMSVNCATYAANNPGMGLQGICSNGTCV